MSRIKVFFAVLLLTVIVGVVPQAQAAATTTVEVTIAGSSAMWQSMALGAYALAQTAAGSGGTYGHWTSKSNVVNLVDTRVSPVNNDAGTLWVVWSTTSAGATKVWSFNKVDSVVGDRCYFAQPHCEVVDTDTTFASGAQISTSLWGADSTLSSNVSSLFTSGKTLVSVAATDIRPEDAAFATCRINSQLGASAVSTNSDNLDGLGYNPNNAPGACPAAGLAQANYVGTPVYSGYANNQAATTDAANVLSFNISGSDPISGTAIPTASVLEVGATPIVFIKSQIKGTLANVTDATPPQLQQVFAGQNCDASAFGSTFSGAINIFLREPTSGTYNTAEATIFRRPTVYPSAGLANGFLGLSQETGVGAGTVLANNPLAADSSPCVNGAGVRYRGIGTGEVVKSVQNSNAAGVFATAQDGISYTFFSYGNVSKIAGSPNYGYITVNGVDPIFASYGPQHSTGVGSDPGQPATAANPGMLPLNTPCGTGSAAFPCPETTIWAFNPNVYQKQTAPAVSSGLSFPNIRNGSYPAWSIVRLVSNGTPLTNAKALVTKSNTFVVTSIPDYVPFTAVKLAAGVIGPNAFTDPGLLVVRSHYQQQDGAGTALNLVAAAPFVNNIGSSAVPEAGGDMGGQILNCQAYGATSCAYSAKAPNNGAPQMTIQNVQGNQGFQVRP